LDIKVDVDVLYHSASKLAQRLEQEKAAQPVNSTLVFELSVALDFIAEEFASTIADMASLLPERQITFKLLWAILPPGELLFYKDDLSEPRVMRLRESDIVEPMNAPKWRYFECEYFDYDGKIVGTTIHEEIKITDYPGSKKISDLPIYPLQYHPDARHIKELLIARGKKGLRLRDRQLKEYNGHGLKEKVSDKGYLKGLHDGLRRNLDEESHQRGYEKFNVSSTYLTLARHGNLTPIYPVSVTRPNCTRPFGLPRC
jgi:hypothetical protein